MRSQLVIANTTAASYWSQVAPAWSALAPELEQISATPGQLAQDRLDLQPGHHVVDLGCGTALTTLQLAHRVGESGSVVGVDISAEMLTHARRRAQQDRIGNVRLVHADIQTHRFGDRFDRAYSRFGLMFFTDPVAAFGNIHHALRPGGRLAFVSFQGADANTWMTIPAEAARTVIDTPPAPADPERPDLYSLADPDRVTSILAAAGFHDIDIVAHNDHVETSEHQIPDMAAARTHIGLVAEALRGADADTRARVTEAIESALRN
jgi:SAM-dependent methyltransferase